MVSTELSEGISETLDILNHMENTYTEKLPKKFREFLEKNKSVDYIPSLDHSKKINEMNLKEKTKDILAIIYMNYWCTPEQKEDYQKVLNENEKRYQEKQKEKYTLDNVFKNKKQSVIQDKEDDTQVSMIEHKESFISKIVKKIKNIFKRN